MFSPTISASLNIYISKKSLPLQTFFLNKLQHRLSSSILGYKKVGKHPRHSATRHCMQMYLVFLLHAASWNLFAFLTWVRLWISCAEPDLTGYVGHHSVGWRWGPTGFSSFLLCRRESAFISAWATEALKMMRFIFSNPDIK